MKKYFMILVLLLVLTGCQGPSKDYVIEKANQQLLIYNTVRGLLNNEIITISEIKNSYIEMDKKNHPVYVYEFAELDKPLKFVKTGNHWKLLEDE